MLGEALTASGGKVASGDAVAELTRATAREPKNSDAFRKLAIAYAQKNKIPEADLASAQGGVRRTATTAPLGRSRTEPRKG